MWYDNAKDVIAVVSCGCQSNKRHLYHPTYTLDSSYTFARGDFCDEHLLSHGGDDPSSIFCDQDWSTGIQRAKGPRRSSIARRFQYNSYTCVILVITSF